MTDENLPEVVRWSVVDGSGSVTVASRLADSEVKLMIVDADDRGPVPDLDETTQTTDGRGRVTGLLPDHPGREVKIAADTTDD